MIARLIQLIRFHMAAARYAHIALRDTHLMNRHLVSAADARVALDRWTV